MLLRPRSLTQRYHRRDTGLASGFVCVVPLPNIQTVTINLRLSYHFTDLPPSLCSTDSRYLLSVMQLMSRTPPLLLPDVSFCNIQAIDLIFLESRCSAISFLSTLPLVLCTPSFQTIFETTLRPMFLVIRAVYCIHRTKYISSGLLILRHSIFACGVDIYEILRMGHSC
jgi:hypothetical protein